MNKKELIAKISEKSELNKKESERALNAFMETVEETLASGDTVMLVGFGSFSVVERKERLGRNPRDPEEVIVIEACKSPKFTAGKGLKDIVNGK